MKPAATYAEARAAFQAECSTAGQTFWSHVHPLRGPGGEVLATDVTLFGDPSSTALLVLVSGTHGLEGLGGSACQRDWLVRGGPQQLPRQVAVLLIHLINPWGCAWRRRQTEDNVDLNRNFLDFKLPRPENRGYARIHDALLRNASQALSHTAILGARDEFERRHGQGSFLNAVFQGQYTHPKGVGFGGQQPTWSNRTLRSLLQVHAARAERVALIDFHTGLGPYASAMLIAPATASRPAAGPLRPWFGDATIDPSAAEGDVPYRVDGDLLSAAAQVLPAATFVAVALEFGTQDSAKLVELQLRDTWLELFATSGDPRIDEVRQELQEFFFPSDAAWLARVTQRSGEVIERVTQGLAKSDACW